MIMQEKPAATKSQKTSPTQYIPAPTLLEVIAEAVLVPFLAQLLAFLQGVLDANFDFPVKVIAFRAYANFNTADLLTDRVRISLLAVRCRVACPIAVGCYTQDAVCGLHGFRRLFEIEVAQVE
jgi:hypothetical protein